MLAICTRKSNASTAQGTVGRWWKTTDRKTTRTPDYVQRYRQIDFSNILTHGR